MTSVEGDRVHIDEPREWHHTGLYLWAALFGGVPLIMAVTSILRVLDPGNGEPSSTVGFDGDVGDLWLMLLFPAVAVVPLFFSRRRQRRAGFVVDELGLHGAHDAEQRVIPWEEVERLEWAHAGPTSSVTVNDRPLPSGPALFAVLRSGERIRVMQRVAASPAQREAIEEQLVAAVEIGLVPVPVVAERDVAVPPEPDAPALPSRQWEAAPWQPTASGATSGHDWPQAGSRRGLRITEPRELFGWFIWLWAAMFGGIPLLMLVGFAAAALASGNGEPSSGGLPAELLFPMAFLLLFPTVAAVVVAVAMRRWRRAGFLITPTGLAGAHDAEGYVIPWEQIDRLTWMDAAPTVNVRVNGRPLPSGPSLYALLHDGRAVRVMQRVAHTPARQQLMDRQLRDAVDRGLIPVAVRLAADGVEPFPTAAIGAPWMPGPWRAIGENGYAVWRPADPTVPPPAEQAADVDDEPHWPTV